MASNSSNSTGENHASIADTSASVSDIYLKELKTKALKTLQNQLDAMDSTINDLKREECLNSLNVGLNFGTPIVNSQMAQSSLALPFFHGTHRSSSAYVPADNQDTIALREYSSFDQDASGFQWKKAGIKILREKVQLALISQKQQGGTSSVTLSWKDQIESNSQWEAIASQISPDCTANDAKLRHVNVENPFCDNSWSPELDELLRELVNTHGHDWEGISQLVTKHNVDRSVNAPIRTPFHCLSRYQTKIAKLCNTVWTDEEDDLLTKTVSKIGDQNWNLIATFLPSRTGDQCYRRWLYTLSPEIKLGDWSVVEDRRLALSVYAICQSDIESTIEWALVQELMPGRTDAQCRERWMNVLAPSVKPHVYTAEEDERLLSLVEKHGVGNWAIIQKEHVPQTRTANQIYRRFKSLRPAQWQAYRQSKKS